MDLLMIAAFHIEEALLLTFHGSHIHKKRQENKGFISEIY